MIGNAKVFMLGIAALAAIVPVGAQSSVGVVTMDVPYTVNGKDFVGFIAYAESLNEPRPGVIVVHEWRGINDYAKKRAVDLAKEGFVAFALDMYGDGKEVTMDQARSMSRAVGSDFPAIKDRFNAALDILTGDERVADGKIAAIGYCFGGGIVLNMARMGTEIDGVVSFHGSINTGLNAEPGDITTEILAFQGDGDPAAPPDKREAFQNEMDGAGAEYEYVIYDGVKAHNFTNPDGNSYYEKEANMAWNSMLEFFETIF